MLYVSGELSTYSTRSFLELSVFQRLMSNDSRVLVNGSLDVDSFPRRFCFANVFAKPFLELHLNQQFKSLYITEL